MKNLRTFGERLTELMQRDALTATALAHQLGLNSSTPVSRLQHDQTSPARLEAFCDLMTQKRCFDPDDLTSLRESIIINRLGKSAYIAQNTIHDLIFEGDIVTTEARMENGMPLSAYLERMPSENKMMLLCFGCCDAAVFQSIAPLFADPQRRVEMAHFVSPNADTRNYARIIRAIGAIFFDRRYQLYVANTTEQGTDSFFFLPNMLMARCGTTEALLAIRADHTVSAISFTRHGELYETVLAMIARLSPVPKLLERDHAVVSNLRDDLFLRYQREKNRVLCHLRPEPGFLMMPVPVLMEAFESMGALQDDAQMRRQVRAILQSRERELRKPNRMHTMVFCHGATQRFFQTGLPTDPLKGMTAFTPEQRRRILAHLLDLAHTTPSLNIRFLRPDIHLKQYQIAYFEGHGVLVNRAHQIYTTDGHARELLLTDITFRQQYRNYFEGILLPEYTFSVEDSLRLLEKMHMEIP